MESDTEVNSNLWDIMVGGVEEEDREYNDESGYQTGENDPDWEEITDIHDGGRQQKVKNKFDKRNDNNFDVEERHRAKLTDIVMRRKQEDEEAFLLLERATAKRKKFKAALLERAMKSRNQSLGSSADVIDGDDANTVENINIPMKKSEIKNDFKGDIRGDVRGIGGKKGAPVLKEMETEEQRKMEEERVEQIAVLRRKFKEQHKNILQDLMIKNREEEKKVEDALNIELEKKRKRKLKGESLVARRLETLSALVGQIPGQVLGPGQGQGLGPIGGNQEILKDIVRTFKEGKDAKDMKEKKNSNSKSTEDGGGEKVVVVLRKEGSEVSNRAVSASTLTSEVVSNSRRGSFNTAAGSGLASVRAQRVQSAEGGQTVHRYSDEYEEDFEGSELEVEVGDGESEVEGEGEGEEELEGGYEVEKNVEGSEDVREGRVRGVKGDGQGEGEVEGELGCENENEGEVEEIIGQNEEDEKARKMRRIASKLYRAKVVSYLLALQDQKKREELEKKKKEESKKKRVQILSARVASEASERKLMSSEDKIIHQNLALSLAIVAGVIKKVRQKNGNGNECEGSPKNLIQGPRPSVQPSSSLYSVQEKDKDKDKESKDGKEGKEGENKVEKPAVKVTAEQTDAMISRLSLKAKGSEENIGVPARDYADWKRKNCVPSDAQVSYSVCV